MICCSVLREIGKQHEFMWKKMFFTFFLLVEFLPFVLLCMVTTVSFNYIALFHPSVQTKHAENERQHVTF